ncbi:putative isomerase motif protein [Ranid herpesvirus 3]|uniref:Putative isomerase motif protein n=1 Tax=Ranid herpesvirus 3 TaxID=1987509 RepID=A0A1X9T5C3_9VIRU|nr:putative isomerase motif protein [Ranid herpesvirus 3]ARR28900.1 putative isomerase motif protein [Ranid herpesvirus 3]
MENIAHNVSDLKERLGKFGYRQNDVIPCLAPNPKLLFYTLNKSEKTYSPVYVKTLPYLGVEESLESVEELLKQLYGRIDALQRSEESDYKPVCLSKSPNVPKGDFKNILEEAIASIFKSAERVSSLQEILITVKGVNDELVTGLQRGELFTVYELLDEAITAIVHLMRLCPWVDLPWNLFKAAWAGLQLPGLSRKINDGLYKPLAAAVYNVNTLYDNGKKTTRHMLRIALFRGHKVQFGTSFAIGSTFLNPSSHSFINQFTTMDAPRCSTIEAISHVTTGPYATKELREKLAYILSSSTHFAATFQYLIDQIPFHTYPLDQHLVGALTTEEETLKALEKVFKTRTAADVAMVCNRNGSKFAMPAPLVHMVELKFSDREPTEFGHVPSLSVNPPQTCIALNFRVCGNPTKYTETFEQAESIRQVIAAEKVRQTQDQLIFTGLWSFFNQIEYTESGNVCHNISNKLTQHMEKTFIGTVFNDKPGAKSTVKTQLGGHGAFAMINACKIALLLTYGNALLAAARKGLRESLVETDCDELYTSGINGKLFWSVADEFLCRVANNDLFVQSMLKDQLKKNEQVFSHEDLMTRPNNVRAPMILRKWDAAPQFNEKNYNWLTQKHLSNCPENMSRFAKEVLSHSTIRADIVNFMKTTPGFIYLRPLYYNIFNTEIQQLDMSQHCYRNAPLSCNVKCSYFIGAQGDVCKLQCAIHFSTTVRKIPNYIIQIESLGYIYKLAAYSQNSTSTLQPCDNERVGKFIKVISDTRLGCPVPISLLNDNNFTKKAFDMCTAKLEELGFEIEHDQSPQYYENDDVEDCLEKVDEGESLITEKAQSSSIKKRLQGVYDLPQEKRFRNDEELGVEKTWF